MLQKLIFKPGINHEQTRYAADGGWFDCDKIRFRSGLPEKIGGWTAYSGVVPDGVPRSLFNFVALDGSNYMSVGTTLRYYIEEGGALYNITPIRRTSSLGSNPITTGSAGSGVVSIADSGHGAVINDFVTLSGATTTDGVTAAQLNTTHQVVTVTSAGVYTIDTGGAASSGSTAGGGASVEAQYEINTGLDVGVSGTGWGTSTWGRLTWGSSASTELDDSDQLRLWSQDSFGEDLIFCARDGGVYYWDKSDGTGARAVALSSESGALDVPTVARQVMISNNDRHVLAFGCNDRGATTQDKLLIRWSDQENAVDWTPTTTNTAGDVRLNNGSEIITAHETRQEILVWTDATLNSLRFVGPPFTFGQNVIDANTSIIAPNAVASLDEATFWMGNNNFYVYSGRVDTLPCTVRRYVFSDLNDSQKEKIFAGTNKEFNEIIWFYPSSSSEEIDRYVIFNTEAKVWYYGTLARTAWVDKTTRSYPIAANPDDKKLYNHEIGQDDGTTDPISAISAHVESADFELGEGDALQFVSKIIPDVSFVGSDSDVPAVIMNLKPRNFPGSAFGTASSSSVTATTTVDVEQFTEQAFVRLRSRELALRIESTATGVQWRLGAPRIEVRPDGKR